MGFIKKVGREINRPIKQVEKKVIRPVAKKVKNVLSKVEGALPGITPVQFPIGNGTKIGISSQSVEISINRNF